MLNDLLVNIGYLLGILLIVGFLLLGLTIIVDLVVQFYIDKIQKR